MRKTLHALFAILILFLVSCKQPNLTPAYIQINFEDINNCVDVSTFNATHGVNFDTEQLSAFQQHNFTHVNVYVNGKNLGCWQVPCKVPVLEIPDEDSSSVYILPAFRKTGMTNTVQGYPFFNVLQKKVLLRRGETFSFANDPLTFVYSSYSTCPYLETFSNSSSFSPKDSVNNPITFQPTRYDGRTVGCITLNNSNGLSFDVASIPITLPARNYYQYLEITYNIEANMDVSLQLSTAQHPYTIYPIGGMYATNGEWKTIYFDIASIINERHYTGASNTNLTLVLSGSGDAGKNTNYYIDNIKIVYEPSI